MPAEIQTSARTETRARPRRSVLYMPASNGRALEKARSLAADVLIFDLEDAVAPDAKPRARTAAVAAVRSGYGHREVLIRVNGLDTPWGAADVAAVASSAAHGLVLPKVNSAEDIARVAAMLDTAGTPAGFAIWAMIETADGVLAGRQIAGAHPRVAGVIAGTADLAKELHCAHPADRGPMLYALQHCVLAARAAGVAVLDGVHLDISDMHGYELACRQGRALGFDGKTLIHPSQIALANDIFAPAPAEIERARRVIAAHAVAVAEGQGITLLDGRLVEALHVAEAHRLIAAAEMISALTEDKSQRDEDA